MQETLSLQYVLDWLIALINNQMFIKQIYKRQDTNVLTYAFYMVLWFEMIWNDLSQIIPECQIKSNQITPSSKCTQIKSNQIITSSKYAQIKSNQIINIWEKLKSNQIKSFRLKMVIWIDLNQIKSWFAPISGLDSFYEFIHAPI